MADSNVSKNSVLGNFGMYEILVLGAMGYAAVRSFTAHDDVLGGCMIAIPAVLMLNKAGGDQTNFGEGESAKFSVKNFSLTELLTVGAVAYGGYRLYTEGDEVAAVCAWGGAALALFSSGRTEGSISL